MTCCGNIFCGIWIGDITQRLSEYRLMRCLKNKQLLDVRALLSKGVKISDSNCIDLRELQREIIENNESSDLREIMITWNKDYSCVRSQRYIKDDIEDPDFVTQVTDVF